MKKLLVFFCFFSALCAAAQNKQYYNWNGKACEPEAACFISLTDKSDSGQVRRDFYVGTKKLQMKGLYKDSALKIPNGRFSYFYVNEQLYMQGNFVNGKKDGIWVSYHYNGMLKDSVEYVMGKTRTITAWYSNGVQSDSVVINADGIGVHVVWFDNGGPYASGRTLKGKKEKKWQYFHKNGQLAAIEEYEQDKLVSRVYYDEAGMQLADTTNRDRPGEFKGGQSKWRSYLTGNLRFPEGVSIKNTNKITVVVNAIIDEAGNVTDAFVSVPVHPKFDEEALRVFNRSPKWVPAIAQNRYVKHYIRQPVTFGQFD